MGGRNESSGQAESDSLRPPFLFLVVAITRSELPVHLFAGREAPGGTAFWYNRGGLVLENVDAVRVFQPWSWSKMIVGRQTA